MGAFSEFFGFDGRIVRLGYLWRAIAVTVALAGLTVAGVVGLASMVRPLGGGLYDAWLRRLDLIMTLVALWAGLALATRRLRDMGLEPAHIVPIFGTLWVADTVLLRPLARLHPESFGVVENGWWALQLLAALPLLFWPTGARRETTPAEFARAEPTSYMNWRESA